MRIRITNRTGLKAPIAKIIRKLVVSKMFKWDPSGNQIKATRMTRIQNWDHADILRYYNAVIRGLVNYYSFADNLHRLNAIWWYIRHSCA